MVDFKVRIDLIDIGDGALFERKIVTHKTVELGNAVCIREITNWKGKGKPPSREETIKLATLLYLDQDETNVLLASAGYAPEHIKKELREGLTSDIETVKIKNLIVQHLILPNKSALNQQQTRCDYYVQVSPPPRYVERVEVLSDVRAQVFVFVK